jgi:hypothetical protein
MKRLLNAQRGNTRVIFAGGIVYQNPYKTHFEALDFAKRMSDRFNIGFSYTLIK